MKLYISLHLQLLTFMLVLRGKKRLGRGRGRFEGDSGFPCDWPNDDECKALLTTSMLLGSMG